MGLIDSMLNIKVRQIISALDVNKHDWTITEKQKKTHIQ